ncbi:unnamed protein product, partial [marine sediment metagenome]
DLEIIDENVEEIDYDQDYQLVAVSTMTHQAVRAYQICAEFRKRGVHTVVGGIHPSVEPDEAEGFADTVVVGEAESIWPALIRDLREGRPRAVYRATEYPPVEIEQIPTPRYDLLADKGHKMVWLNTSRGCPHDCEFCVATRFFGARNRPKTQEQVCREVESVKSTFPRVLIGFGDNNMFLGRSFSRDLLSRFVDLRFAWVAQSDISIGEDEQFLELLFRAGCRTLFIGFETLNRASLAAIYRGEGGGLKSSYLDRYSEMV